MRFFKRIQLAFSVMPKHRFSGVKTGWQKSGSCAHLWTLLGIASVIRNGNMSLGLSFH